jgi:hypothetical protein
MPAAGPAQGLCDLRHARAHYCRGALKALSINHSQEKRPEVFSIALIKILAHHSQSAMSLYTCGGGPLSAVGKAGFRLL